ncbi:phage virion morphogenesis protein [Spirosoma aerolatum]|uniref:phage virion morphogenesis protein n=1 Tax=Spirosoma aerolatum TaxID=1211326 RepID=UPI0009AEC193|nr:phage virion morphogenesis protein [Spirosoma aerolatum]
MGNYSPEDFQRRTEAARQFLQAKARTIIRVKGVKHFKDSFRNEGFTDETLEKWPDISEARKKQKRRRNGSLPGILYDTGELMRSVTGEEDSEGVVFSSDKAYAQRHNEGLDGMPQRQFMGESKALIDGIIKDFEKALDRIFQ